MSSAIILGNHPAHAGIYGAGTLTIPLPLSVPTSSYVEVLGYGTYTPKLTDGTVTLTYSVVGQGGNLEAQSDFECPPERPDPFLRLVLVGAQGELSAGASISGTTTDPGTGDDWPFQAKVPDEPVVVEASTDDIQILRICGESDGSSTPNSQPEASFEASCSNLTCSFTEASSDPDGDVTGWEWKFGDGTSSMDQRPTHSYATAGSYQVSLTVTDDRGAADTTSTAVTVYAPLTITTTSMPDGTTGGLYSQALQAEGGSPSYSWSLVSGALPPGLSLSSWGTVDGKPRKPGSYSFAVQVTDSSTTRSTSRTLNITIAPPGGGD